MRRQFALGSAALVLAVAALLAQVPAGAPVLALRGGRVITVSHGVQEGGTVLIANGRIAAVGSAVGVPAGAEVIDVSGQWVLPGLIDAFSNLGTGEPESFGRDEDEATGPILPHMRVVDALNPANRYLAGARRAGITSALSVPGEGNVLSGQSAVISLSGDRVEDMVLRFPAAVHATLGEAPKLRYGRKEQAPSTRMGEVALLRQALLDAEDYRQKRAREPLKTAADLKLEALVPLLEGKRALVVSADRRNDILSALKVADEFKLRLIISHGTESYRVAERLAASRVPVILGPSAAEHRRLETFEARRDAALQLSQAGVSFAFQCGPGGAPEGLLAEARRAVANGLPDEQAIRALTLSAAEILGVADSVGSIDPGKRADLAVFRGDPLRDAARLTMLFIRGKRVPVE